MYAMAVILRLEEIPLQTYNLKGKNNMIQR